MKDFLIAVGAGLTVYWLYDYQQKIKSKEQQDAAAAAADQITERLGVPGAVGTQRYNDFVYPDTIQSDTPYLYY